MGKRIEHGLMELSNNDLEGMIEKMRDYFERAKTEEGRSIVIFFGSVNEDDENESVDGQAIIHGSARFLAFCITSITDDYPMMAPALAQHYMAQMMEGKNNE